jgi:hypothetical protein
MEEKKNSTSKPNVEGLVTNQLLNGEGILKGHHPDTWWCYCQESPKGARGGGEHG